MPITRAKASQLLNQKEMALYDDSRANGLRRLDAKALGDRVARARAGRDRARDLVQRQKLASRARTGSKRGASGAANQRSKDKAELLADILSRFETQLRETRKAGKTGGATAARARKAAKPTTKATKATGKTTKKAAATTTGKRSARKTAGTSTAARTAGTAKKAPARAKKTAVRGTAATATSKAAKKRAPAATTATEKAAAKSAIAKKAAAKKTKKTAGSRGKRRITPAQALKQTRALLEAKQAEAQAPKPWQSIGGDPAHAGDPGYQSGSAADGAHRLHAAEARLQAIQGSSSTRDRINQGKRDHRNDE